MRIAVLGDIHGNIHALKAVEQVLSAERVEEVWCLGDSVGYSPFPNECLDWLKNNVSRFVLGNHELAVLGFVDLELLNDYARKGIEWTRKVLKDEYREFLMGAKIIDFTDCCQLVHDTPESPGSMKYILSKEDAFKALISQQRDFCFFAHTHLPVAYSLSAGEVEEYDISSSLFLDGKFLLNPGSVGQPRDNDPRASFLIFYGDRVRWFRVEYDVKAAARAILEAGLPKFLAARLLLGV